MCCTCDSKMKPLCATVVLAVLLSNAWLVRADFTSAQKTELVVIHNRLREAVYPTATKMNFVTWNTRLESLAQTAAAKCNGEHNYGGDYAGLGENIYTGFRTNATEIVLAWHIEKAAYSYCTAKCDTSGMSQLSSCGHYLQLVTDSVLEIGCGHYLCGGSNMVYCEYGSGSASPPYASGTSSCSKCPTHRGRCLNGLCVNSSMLATAGVLAYDSTASVASTGCQLNCSNCGVSASVAGVLDCYCNCPSAVSGGAFCDTRVANSQLSCSACSQLGTPCLNGGTEPAGSSSCSCQCPDAYVGQQCQIYRPYYLNGMRLGIGSQQFCAFGQCVGVPVTRTVFKTAIWTSLKAAIASAVNSFCNSNSASYATCCSSGQLPAAAKPLVAATDVGYLDSDDLQTDNSGMLSVVVYVNVSSSSNTLCPGSRRKKRAVTQQPMVSQSTLQSAIDQYNSTISSALGACCGSSVQSAASYQSYASTKYGISGTGGGAASGGASFISLLWMLCLSCSIGHLCRLASRVSL